MIWDALAQRSLFFLAAPPLIPWPVPATGEGNEWWFLTVASLIVLAAMGGGRGYSRFDLKLLDLIQRYDPPNESLIYLTSRNVASEIATVYWPAQDAEMPQGMDHFFGMVLIEASDFPGVPPTWFLDFCFDVLVFGGKILVMDGLRVSMVIRKDDFRGN
jgi:hypothetical protein